MCYAHSLDPVPSSFTREAVAIDHRGAARMRDLLVCRRGQLVQGSRWILMAMMKLDGAAIHA